MLYCLKLISDYPYPFLRVLRLGNLFIVFSAIACTPSYASPSFSIFCTNNRDSTGNCFRNDNGNPIKCDLIPGETIICFAGNPPGEKSFNCLNISAYNFMCKESLDESFADKLNSNRVTNTLEASPPPYQNPAFSGFDKNVIQNTF